jgi:tetratricopeptide (TPR) repeat protein
MDFDRISAVALSSQRKFPPDDQEKLQARRLREQAAGLNEEGRFAEALEISMESLRIEPLETAAIGVLAWSLAGMDEGVKALVIIDKASKYEPRNADLALSRGRCLKEMGRLDEAAAAFDTAQSLDPGNAVISFEQALCQVGIGRDDLALPNFDIALRRNDKHAPAWDQKGDCLRRLGRLGEALACLDKAVALAPHLPSAWFNKAQVLEALGRGPEAGQCYAKFVSVAPAYQAEKQFLARQKVLELGANPA